MNPDELLTDDDVSRAVRRPKSWLAKARMRGDGPLFLKIGRKVLYRRGDVAAWLTRCARQSTAKSQRAS
jgi:hypothetical protein